MATRKHGLWISKRAFDNLDGRLHVAKEFKAVKTELENAIGGDPSPQEGYLIDRAVFLLYRITTIERMVVSGQTLTDHQEGYYNAWVNRLQSILQTIGLKRVPKLADADPIEEMLDAK